MCDIPPPILSCCLQLVLSLPVYLSLCLSVPQSLVQILAEISFFLKLFFLFVFFLRMSTCSKDTIKIIIDP